MTNSNYSIKVPGKIMIAGEYAVLEPNYKAVVVAVNRYVTVNIKCSIENSLSIPKWGLENITWEGINGEVEFSVLDERLNFIRNSLTVVKKFLQENSVILYPFKLEIKSELDDPLSGKKYGLGSSAAVVVAVIAAILRLHDEKKESLNLDEIFKLSAIAHVKTQGSGSGADIAAAVYGGWLEYSAFSMKWILDELKKEKITELIEKPWPNLLINRLNPPEMLQLAVGWTKEPASTALMLRSFENFKEENLYAYNNFLKESLISVARLIQSFKTDDFKKAINSLEQNREVLQELGACTKLNIETKKLKTLCSIAEKFGSGKPSGAGGGDCGIAFVKDDEEKYKLYKAWEASDINVLNLKVSKSGVSIEKI